jgi:ATP-dependent Clp protease ATP-binding subunit ClpC
VFERFTERARQVVVLAQDEARGLKHNYIGTEHLLLGLIREKEGLAVRVLDWHGLTLEEVRAQVVRIIGVGEEELVSGQIPFTPRAKKVLELSLREALSLGHNYIGTEHILLGLVRVDEGIGARILLDFGGDAETIRNDVIHMLSGPGRAQFEPEGPPLPFAPETPPLAPEVGAEIDRVRREKEEALEQQEFERAAALRDRERRLVQAARGLQRAWKDEPGTVSVQVAEARAYPVPGAAHRRMRRGRRMRTWQAEAVVVGWAMFGLAAALGVLLGWLIWG